MLDKLIKSDAFNMFPIQYIRNKLIFLFQYVIEESKKNSPSDLWQQEPQYTLGKINNTLLVARQKDINAGIYIICNLQSYITLLSGRFIFQEIAKKLGTKVFFDNNIEKDIESGAYIHNNNQNTFFIKTYFDFTFVVVNDLFGFENDTCFVCSMPKVNNEWKPFYFKSKLNIMNNKVLEEKRKLFLNEGQLQLSNGIEK